jgi:hypothetical protein
MPAPYWEIHQCLLGRERTPHKRLETPGHIYFAHGGNPSGGEDTP